MLQAILLALVAKMCIRDSDYAAVDAMPFGYRVMKEKGKLVFVRGEEE